MRVILLLLIASFAITSCNKNQPKTERNIVVLSGARIIDGNGGTPIENGVLIIEDGKIVSAATVESSPIPNGIKVIDVSGKTIIPGIINTHGHVGETLGIEGGHYSRDNVIDNLSIYARYGVTTVYSLGGDKKEAEDIREINDSTSTQRARFYMAGAVINGDTPAAATAVVDSNAHMGVDIMKIRVDDNLGTSSKMSEDIYRAVISRSHELGYRIATHMYYLEDARKLLEAGTDMLAHSIRDAAVDESLINLLKSRNVPYCATLTRELSTFVYAETPEFFNDPFFQKEYDSTVIAPLKDPARQAQMRNSKGAKTYKQQLPVAMANLKTLQQRGVPIVFGTDSGVPTRFMGYFEHIEMSMMAEAGLTPMEIIISFSKNAAEHMHLKNLGTITSGNWADFVVLDDNPLTDIENCRKINQVYIGGVAVAQK